MAAAALDPEERGISRVYTPNRTGPTPMSVIAESGLYKLILRANSSPTAKRFQDWVTKVVLPSPRGRSGNNPDP